MRLPASIALGWLLLACGPRAEAPAPLSASPDTEGAAAARVGDEEISVSEVDAWLKEEFFRRATRNGDPSQLHQVRSQAAQELATQRLVEAEAARRGMDVEAMLRAEVEGRVRVEDADIEAFYQENKERIGERSLDELRDDIRSVLEEDRREEAREAFLAGLREAAGFEILLEPPRFEIAGKGNTLGPADAPVTVVEFSDYQCPFCKRAEPVVAQLLERYPEQIRFEYRHFPLDNIHPRARPAAEAASCAGEQGKFWQYHRRIFENTPALGDEDLARIAGEVGLDASEFQACVDEGRHKATVEADVAAGESVGVNGTPAFFVNGIPITGARDVEEFAKLVDAELSRLDETPDAGS